MKHVKLELAPKSDRLINLIIDTAVLVVIWFITDIILYIMGITPFVVQLAGRIALLMPLVITFPVFAAYFIIGEYKFQMTFGKLVTKTRVINFTGGRPSLRQIVIRTLCKAVPLEYISFIFSAEGMHDRFSKTRVIKV